MDTTTITVGGEVFDITGATIEGVLAVGEYVEIHVTVLENGVWLASTVEVSDDPDGVFKLEGVVDEVGAGFIVIDGVWVDTSGLGIDFAVGEQVEIHAILADDGTWLAVSVDDDDPMDDDGDESSGIGDDDGDESSGSSNDDDCPISPPDSWSKYTVQAGDTLSGIAAASGISVTELAAVNCIDDTGSIVAGMRLSVPKSIAASLDDHDDVNDDHRDDVNDDSHDDDSNDDHRDDVNDDSHDDDSNDDDHGNDDNESSGSR
jgi:LysM repeat protein